MQYGFPHCCSCRYKFRMFTFSLLHTPTAFHFPNGHYELTVPVVAPRRECPNANERIQQQQQQEGALGAVHCSSSPKKM